MGWWKHLEPEYKLTAFIVLMAAVLFLCLFLFSGCAADKAWVEGQIAVAFEDVRDSAKGGATLVQATDRAADNARARQRKEAAKGALPMTFVSALLKGLGFRGLGEILAVLGGGGYALKKTKEGQRQSRAIEVYKDKSTPEGQKKWEDEVKPILQGRA